MPALAPRRRIRLACAIAIGLAAATVSHAAVPCPLCTCVVPEYETPEEAVMEAFYAADAVFLGEVVEIGTDSGIGCPQVAGCADPDPDPAADPFAARVIVGFRVETSLKGGNEDGRLSTNSCTRTRPVENAAFDVEILSR